MTAMETALERFIALVTGRSAATIASDIAGVAESGPVPAWQALNGSLGDVPVYLDRQTALARDEAPSIIVRMVPTGSTRNEGEVDPTNPTAATGTLDLRLMFSLEICVRHAMGYPAADAILTQIHPAVMADRTLTNLLSGALTLQSAEWYMESADVEVAGLTVNYSAALTVDERTLLSALA
jgi:hypothetical protein